LANTSIATASRALNDTSYVAPETRARVLQAARKLNYHPNLQARGLRQRASRSIGLIIPDLLNTYYTALADTAIQMLSQQGYNLVLAATRDDPEIERATINQMVGQAVEGLVWVPTSPDVDLINFLQDQETPFVAIVRRVYDDRCDTILFEDLLGSKAATHHLISLGHTRISYVGGDIAYSSNFDRWQGYLKAHEEAGLEVDESLVKLGTTRSTWGLMAIPELLHHATPPTAIFVGSNALMPGVMSALRQFTVKVPDEISLICFDDVDWFSYSVPPISAVKTRYEKLAEMALDLLLGRIQLVSEERQERPVHLSISFELVLRQSTASPPDNPFSTAKTRLSEVA
jgi:LacI family transcriptional regulator